jgi:uncharacterized protein YndB with AHSA1/START domain
MSTTPSAIPSIVKEVVVPCARDRAFDLFTAQIQSWWPMATHSVGGASSTGLTFDREHITEQLADGTRCTWGTVTGWQPPTRVAFTWHPGGDPVDCTEVSVDFTPVPGGTHVRLRHSGWERLRDSAPILENYRSGWDAVLAGFAGAAG